jgi:hypothetical protein
MVRHLARSAALLGLLALVTAWQVNSASAGIGWCQTDPVVKIDGGTADIFISSSTDMNSAATGPIQIDVYLPAGSVGQVLAVDQGFGFGYVITFLPSTLLQKTALHDQVTVQVLAPATGNKLPVEVDFAPRSSNLSAGSAAGTANKVVSLTTS